MTRARWPSIWPFRNSAAPSLTTASSKAGLCNRNSATSASNPSNQQSRRRPDLDLFRAVAVFKDELMLLDGIDPQPNPFYSGVVAAALIGLALYPTDRTLDFFDKMNRKEGNRKAGRSDPVDAALTVVQEMMLAKAAANAVRQAEICARTLRALLTWIAGPDQRRNQYWLQCGIKAADMEPLLAKLKEKKGIRDDPSL